MVKQRTTLTSVGHLNLQTYNQKYTNYLLLGVLADFAYKLPKSPYFQPILWRYRIDKGDTAQEATEAHPETDSGLGFIPSPVSFRGHRTETERLLREYVFGDRRVSRPRLLFRSLSGSC